MALLASNHSFKAISLDTTNCRLIDLNGEEKSMTLSAPIELIVSGFERYENSFDLIQNCFPFLNADEREFLMTGLNKKEWNEMWKEPELDDLGLVEQLQKVFGPENVIVVDENTVFPTREDK